MRNRPTQDPRERVLAKLTALPEQFRTIRDVLEATIKNLSPTTHHAKLVVALKDLERIVNLFHQQENDYFDFDAVLIDEIMKGWTSAILSPIGSIIPSYRDQWGYVSFFLPIPPSGEKYLPLHIVFIGREKTQVPQLDDYVWLVHELGHALCEANQEKIVLYFVPLFQRTILNLQLSSLSARSRSKEKTMNYTQDLTRAWGLQKENGSWMIGRWTLEILIDVLGVYVLGPAYIDAFFERNRELNPFEIDWSHPPVDLRTNALRLASLALSWHEPAQQLEELITRWQPLFDKLPASKRNKYLALKHQELIEGVVQAGIRFLADTGITQLAPRDVERINRAATASYPLNGIELVVAARLMVRHSDNDHTSLYSWEQEAIQKFMKPEP